jgi:hypothetical protein
MTKIAEPETTRLTITWSKKADHALRTFLGSQGMKKGDLSKFIAEAVRCRIFTSDRPRSARSFRRCFPGRAPEND